MRSPTIEGKLLLPLMNPNFLGHPGFVIGVHLDLFGVNDHILTESHLRTTHISESINVCARVFKHLPISAVKIPLETRVFGLYFFTF